MCVDDRFLASLAPFEGLRRSWRAKNQIWTKREALSFRVRLLQAAVFFFAADKADLTVVHLLDYLTGCIKDTRKVPFADW